MQSLAWFFLEGEKYHILVVNHLNPRSPFCGEGDMYPLFCK